MNLIQPIWEAAARWPEAPALVHSSRSLNYREMREAGLLVAANLLRLGVRAGDRVAVAPDNPVMQLLCRLALAHVGAVAAPTHRQMPAAQWARLVRACGIRALIHSPAGAAWPDAVWAALPATGHLADVDLLEPLPPGTPLPLLADLPPDAPWCIGLSSGTTGQPKAILRSHGGHAASLQATQQALCTVLHLGAGTRLLPHIDLGSLFGLRPVLTQLMQGGTVVLPESPAAADCLRSLLAAGVTHLHTSAWLASELAAALPPGNARLTPQLRGISVGGAALGTHICSSLQLRLTPQIDNNYGSSETGILAMGPMQGPLTLLPGVRAEALSAQGQVLPAGTVGLLRFAVPHAATCYEGSSASDQAASAAVFQGGWFYPGDRGSVGRDGQLVLAARQDDVINLGGVKLDPLELEALIAQQAGVKACAVVGLTRPQPLLAAAVEPMPGLDAAARQALPLALRAACAAAFAPDQVPAAWVLLPALPRNAQGKLLRQALAETLEQDLAGAKRSA